MPELRPYQSDAVARIRHSFAKGHRSVLFASPTGSGKTVLFAHVTSGAARKDKRVLLLAHRGELIDQISQALLAEGIGHGFIAAQYPFARACQTYIASVQTLVRRLSSIPVPGLIVCDEAHHATARNSYGKIFQAFPQARRLGVTATPCRLSGEALGDVFDDLVIGPTVQQLTDDGYLAPARIFAPPTVDTTGLHVRAGEYVPAEVRSLMEKPSVVGDAITHYERHAKGLRAVCFCYSVEHSQYMARAFRDAGYMAAHLDGATGRDTRKQMIADFRIGRLTVLCSVDVVSEGFDVPGIECGILLRPTASESLYLQQVGRCLRTSEGKTAAIILDHVGSTLRHGLPSEDREWSLAGRTASHRKPRDEDDTPVRVCPKCFAAQRPRPACVQCGHVFPVKSRQVSKTDGELRELTPDQLAGRRARRDVGRAKTREELMAIAATRNYKPTWVDHIMQAREGKRRVAQ